MIRRARVHRPCCDRTSQPQSCDIAAKHHGYEGSTDPGMLVHTEFGADVWALVIRAGFSSCELVPFRFPAGVGVLARAGNQ
jgi:hypothetical protein